MFLPLTDPTTVMWYLARFVLPGTTNKLANNANNKQAIASTQINKKVSEQEMARR